jgi:alanine racemase
VSLTTSSATSRLLRPAWIEVDLAALRSNLEVASARSGVPLWAVVKGDGYGHGALAIARALDDDRRVAGFVVAQIEEGLTLREGGIRSEILVLGSGIAAMDAGTAREACAASLAARLVLGVSSRSGLETLRRALPTAGSPLSIHLKVDTGMTRAGLDPRDLAAAVATVCGDRRLALTGIYTHLAESEKVDPSFTLQQVDRFAACLPQLRPELRLVRHAANSCAALYLPASAFDRVRVGGALYGLDLAARAQASPAPLIPALHVRARLVQVREIAAGTTVGYGRRYEASAPTRVGLVPVGYADGYAPRLGSGAVALVRAQRVPVIGAVSMDALTVDLSGVGAEVGDEVVLLGRQGDAEISAHELATWSGVGLYQATCALSRRLARIALG